MEHSMQNHAHFKVIILLGRPAAGKSEITDFLHGVDLTSRRERFHLGELDVIDDFPMLWTWFEEDLILEKKFSKPRLHTDGDGYFKYPYLWDVLIGRIGLEYHKRLRDDPAYHQSKTTIVEFSRGSQHGGYTQAFKHLSEEILSEAGVVYVDVSYEESQRKNRLRYNPQRPDSILEHSLEDEKLERLYRTDDWHEMIMAAQSSKYLSVGSFQVPYVVFENEDDVTTHGGDLLSQRLQETFSRLWEIK